MGAAKSGERAARGQRTAASGVRATERQWKARCRRAFGIWGFGNNSMRFCTSALSLHVQPRFQLPCSSSSTSYSHDRRSPTVRRGCERDPPSPATQGQASQYPGENPGLKSPANPSGILALCGIARACPGRKASPPSCSAALNSGQGANLPCGLAGGAVTFLIGPRPVLKF